MIYFFNIIGMAMLVASVLSMAVIHAISPIDRPYRVHLVATVFSSSTAPIDTSSYAPKSMLAPGNGGSGSIGEEA
jgi:hypothetical protein